MLNEDEIKNEATKNILDFYQNDFETMDRSLISSYVYDINVEKQGLLANQHNKEIFNLDFPLSDGYVKIKKLGSHLKKLNKEQLIKILINDEENRLNKEDLRSVLDENQSCRVS